MSSISSRTRWQTPLLWLAAAPLLWLAAAAVDRRTEVVIENLGAHLRFAVAGTELVLPSTIQTVGRITIHAARSIDPPGGGVLELRHDGGVERWRLPRRFAPAADSPPPVGDWWVDGELPVFAVFDRKVEVTGPFRLRTALRGRFTNDLTVTLTGESTLFFSFRRGLLDNYLVVKDRGGDVLAVTTLDPTPGPDLLATIAQLLRAAAAGCLLIAFVAIVASCLPGPGVDTFRSRAPRPRHNPSRTAVPIAVLLLAAIGISISAWFAVDVLGGLPHQIDEVVDLLQARWLLDGEVAPVATAADAHVAPPFTYVRHGRWLGHCPVGWPALLALGLAVGLPHLVTTALGAALIGLVFVVGRELDDSLTGLAAATMVTVSPLARLMSGTMFPHAACALLVTLALWLGLRCLRAGGWRLGTGLGLTLGACLAVRPLTAVVVAVVLGARLAGEALTGERPRPVWTAIAAATAAGLVASIPTLAHNAAVTGNPFALPYSLASGTMYGLANIPFGLRNLDAVLLSTSAGLVGWGWPFVTGGLALALPLALIGLPFLLRRARSTDWLLLAILLAAVIGHLPTKANGLHGYGARYAFDVGACLFLLAARGWRELARSGRSSPIAVRVVAGLFLALNLTALAELPNRLERYRGYSGVTGALERRIEAAGIDRAVILVDRRALEAWCEGGRLITGPRRHDIVLAGDAGDSAILERAFPDQPVLRWDGEHLLPDDRGGP